MNYKVVLTLCLCLFFGGLTMASAGSIGVNIPPIPEGGFPAGEPVLVPVEITNVENIGFIKATVPGISGGVATIVESDFRNTKTSEAADLLIWYGNYGADGKFNTNGYTNKGTATLFFISVIPSGDTDTVPVTLTFDEIWETTLRDAKQTQQLSFDGGSSLFFSLPVNTGVVEKVTVSYNGGDIEEADLPDNEEVAVGSTYKVSPYRASVDDMYVFKGWNLNDEEIQPGDKIENIRENIVLTAEWYTISFVPDLTDLVIVKNYMIKGGEIDNKYDVNGDGDIDVFDLVLLAQYCADH